MDNNLIELPSGIVVSEFAAEEYYRSNKRPIGIDLFAGAGGMSLGMVQAGIDIVAAVDNDPCCAMTYMCNLGSYPCVFHFIEKSDETRMEKSLQTQMKCDDDSIQVPLVSGSGWISHQDESVRGTEHFFLGDVRKIKGSDILGPLGLEPGERTVLKG